MNTDEFTFEHDEEGKLFCIKIAEEMVKTFGIPLPEAIGRINKELKSKRLVGRSIIYHIMAKEWARTIYYEDETFWWNAKWMAEHTPKPKPYP